MKMNFIFAPTSRDLVQYKQRERTSFYESIKRSSRWMCTEMNGDRDILRFQPAFPSVPGKFHPIPLNLSISLFITVLLILLIVFVERLLKTAYLASRVSLSQMAETIQEFILALRCETGSNELYEPGLRTNLGTGD
jgi:hypothetical protein